MKTVEKDKDALLRWHAGTIVGGIIVLPIAIGATLLLKFAGGESWGAAIGPVVAVLAVQATNTFVGIQLYREGLLPIHPPADQ